MTQRRARPVRLRPLRLVIHPPRVQLIGVPAAAGGDGTPVLLDIDLIETVKPLDVSFVPQDIDVQAVLDRVRPTD